LIRQTHVIAHYAEVGHVDVAAPRLSHREVADAPPGRRDAIARRIDPSWKDMDRLLERYPLPQPRIHPYSGVM
jgi:hypothetical protein